MPTEWAALMAGPVFAIAVASYLLVRVDKTLGELRDSTRDVSAAMREVCSTMGTTQQTLNVIYTLLEKRGAADTLRPS